MLAGTATANGIATGGREAFAPSDTSVWQRIFSFPMALAAALVTTLFVLAVEQPGQRVLSDPDIWWHLNNARTLLTTHHFIRQEMFTFAVAGKPWINFEWIGDLPYYFTYGSFGARGVFAVMMLTADAIVLGVFVLAYLRSGDVKASFLASWVTAMLATVSLAPRTLLFGWLLLVAELLLIEMYRRGRDYIWAAPVLFGLWINTHGSWFIGFVFWLIWVASGFVRVEWGSVRSRRWSGAEQRKLLLVTAVVFAALFVNPYGWRLVAYPLDVAFQQAGTMQFIEEWATLDFHALRGKIVLLMLLAMGALNLVRRRAWPLHELAFAAVCVYGALTYSRFAFLAGIVLAPMLAYDLRGVLGKYDRSADGIGRNVVALTVLGVLTIWLMPTASALRTGMTAAFPEQALARVNELPPDARLFHGFEWGGYLSWKLPQRRVMLDSRVDIFVHEGVLQDYAVAMSGVNSLEMLDKYRIDAALLPRVAPLTYLLAHTPEWRLVHADSNAMLFLRNDQVISVLHEVGHGLGSDSASSFTR